MFERSKGLNNFFPIGLVLFSSTLMLFVIPTLLCTHQCVKTMAFHTFICTGYIFKVIGILETIGVHFNYESMQHQVKHFLPFKKKEGIAICLQISFSSVPIGYPRYNIDKSPLREVKNEFQ